MIEIITIILGSILGIVIARIIAWYLWFRPHIKLKDMFWTRS